MLEGVIVKKIVNVYDLRHYERQKPKKDQTTPVQEKLKREQPPTEYGTITNMVIATMLKFKGISFQRAIMSPQPRGYKMGETIINILGLSISYNTDGRFDDVSSDKSTEARAVVDEVKKVEKQMCMSVEQALVVMPDKIREYTFKRSLSALMAIMEYILQTNDGDNILICRHGGIIEATGSLIKSMIDHGYKVNDLNSTDVDLSYLGGPLATCEGLVYSFEISDDGTIAPISVTPLLLPDEVKALAKIFK